MPVQSPPTKKSSIVHRSESLRSEVSDASQQSKRVSFNRDVHVKRIPRGSAVVDRNGKLVAVLDAGGRKDSSEINGSSNGRLWVNSLAPSKETLPEEDLLREAETVLKHVDSVTCRASSESRPSLERSKSSPENKVRPIKLVQKSPSRLSDFFSRTLPSQIQKSKSQSPPLTKSHSKNYTNGDRKQVLNGVNGDKRSHKLCRSASSDFPTAQLNGIISESEPNLYTASGGTRFKKVAKIKKPHGSRVPLNSFGDSLGNSSSGSDKDSLPIKKVSSSDSPVSSLSGPEEPSMASLSSPPSKSYNNHQPRVSSIVQQLTSRKAQESPERSLSFSRPVEPVVSGGNTHNNNQPFSYISGVPNNKSANNNNNSGGVGGGGASASSVERGRSPNKTTPSGKLLSSPKEVIYAQVVVSGKPGEPGVPGEKRTVHTTVMNGSTVNRHASPQRSSYLLSRDKSPSPKDRSSLSPNNSIQHFVYDNNQQQQHGNKRSKNLFSDRINSSSDREHPTTYRSGVTPRSYDDFDFSAAKPRNNVTTVLLNNVDDDDLSFSSSRDNFFSKYRSPSPSPNYRKPDQSFYFGSSPSDEVGRPGKNDFSSSSFNYTSPTRPNDYFGEPNKSFSSAYLVRDADRKRDSILPSAKLVSTFSNSSNNSPIDYDYYNNDSSTRPSPPRNKIIYSSNDNLSPKPKFSSVESSRYDRYGSSETRKNFNDQKSKRTTTSRNSTPNASNSSVNKLGLRSKENSPSPYRDYHRKSTSPAKTTTTLRKEESSLERKYNKKNKDEQVNSNNNTTTTTTTTKASTSNGGGLISTLMRRNKDKKAQKEKDKEAAASAAAVAKSKEKEKNNKDKEAPASDPDTKDSKIKRQRAKFLSAFLDKNFSSKSKQIEKQKQQEKQQTDGRNNTKPTDSEIEEAERRRDGEYQSWSSGDDEYRFGHHRNGQLTRGKSYNFGDLNEESESKPWYDQNDSDYRREMATSRYTSATLGRPGLRSSSHDSDAARTKSLDRRAYRNRSPPRIIVTPNTPQVEETDKWKNTYDPIIRTFDRDRAHNNHSTLSKKVSGLSKSSYELDDHTADSRAGSKLRYFGDTDVEDLNYHHSNPYLGKSQLGHNSRYLPRSASHLSRGKDNYSNKYYTVPGSSLNSSGSENGSRMSKGSSNAGSQRSVYLHAPAVADIPAAGGMPRRTLSRDELSNYSGHQKQTRHLARSVSVLAPWRPRHYREKYELNYNNDSKENQPYGRPPKPPRSPTRKSMSPSPGRAGSTESLIKTSSDEQQRGGKTSTLTRKKENNVNISRSKSIPKDTRFAGWLRRRRFGKENKA